MNCAPVGVTKNQRTANHTTLVRHWNFCFRAMHAWHPLGVRIGLQGGAQATFRQSGVTGSSEVTAQIMHRALVASDRS